MSFLNKKIKTISIGIVSKVSIYITVQLYIMLAIFSSESVLLFLPPLRSGHVRPYLAELHN